MKLIIVAFLVALPILFANAQQVELEKFLTALQSPEESTSKATIRSLSFGFHPESTLLDFSSIDGKTFDSDTAGVKVFRGSVVCQVEDSKVAMGKKLTTDKKMVVVMFFDKIRNTWAVYSLRDWLNPDEEYATSKAKVDNNQFYTAKEYVYRNLAYWALMAGKVKAAKLYTNLSIENARANKNEDILVGTEKVLRVIL